MQPKAGQNSEKLARSLRTRLHILLLSLVVTVANRTTACLHGRRQEEERREGRRVEGNGISSFSLQTFSSGNLENRSGWTAR